MVPKFVEDFHNITTQLCPKLCEEVQSTKHYLILIINLDIFFSKNLKIKIVQVIT